MADPKLKEMLDAGRFVAAPGVYDLIGVHLANEVGFDAIYASGYWMTASALGLPDLGLATYTEMIDRVARIAAFSDAPVIADADTGYGGLVNLHRTVRGYEKAGVSGIQLEDQVFPKKCGHTPDRPVIPLDEMERKIRVAVDTRSDEALLVIARTDARTDFGIDEAIRRGNAFAAAGADLVFVEALTSESEMERVCREVSGRLIANIAPTGVTPVVPVSRLEELGFAAAIFPALTAMTAMATMEIALRHFRETGESDHPELPNYDFKKACRLFGFDKYRDLAARWEKLES
ncbi:MAG: isocitrate lyase/PEP mutase family protein [Candidatus Sulfomarinibacteraceae bacterium]